MLRLLKDGEVVYCPQCDHVFLWRDDADHKGRMCRCVWTKWRVIACVPASERES